MYETPQERFWSESFGDEYSKRNVGKQAVTSNTALFAHVLTKTGQLGSIIEFGANIGLNLKALRNLLSSAKLSAIEINKYACDSLEEWGQLASIFRKTILNFDSNNKCDLSFTKGVLIHNNPDKLPAVYDKLYAASRRWLLVAEYYNAEPMAIPYRGHSDRLFMRDFAGELLDRFTDLRLIDYGFSYHRDQLFPQDDITWFLMEKRP